MLNRLVVLANRLRASATCPQALSYKIRFTETRYSPNFEQSKLALPDAAASPTFLKERKLLLAVTSYRYQTFAFASIFIVYYVETKVNIFNGSFP